MSDDLRVRSPAPILRTRPATMLTAIGLCVFIMILHLVPEFRNGGPLRSPAVGTATTTSASLQ